MKNAALCPYENAVFSKKLSKASKYLGRYIYFREFGEVSFPFGCDSLAREKGVFGQLSDQRPGSSSTRAQLFLARLYSRRFVWTAWTQTAPTQHI